MTHGAQTTRRPESPSEPTTAEDRTASRAGSLRLATLSLSEWDEHLPDAGFEAFHTAEGLSVLERHSPYELHLFGGFRGDQLVALLPLFRRQGPLGTTAVASPPPGMGVPSLGPLLLEPSPKRSKRERVNGAFTSAVLDALDLDARSLFFQLCSPTYGDPRPYRRHGLSIEPAFTYRIRVEGRDPEDLLASFSRSRRREIRDVRKSDVTVERGGIEGCQRIYEATRRRYAEQGEQFWGDWAYVSDVVESLGERARVYCARDGSGEHLGGVVALYSNDAAYFWLGGSKTSREDICVNSLLHWEILTDIATDPTIPSVAAYDLVGAATERLSRYKSKFGPDLVPYYKVTSHPLKMRLAEAAYRFVH